MRTITCEETEEQVWLHALSLPPPPHFSICKVKNKLFHFFSCIFPLIQTNEFASPCCRLQSNVLLRSISEGEVSTVQPGAGTELWAAQVRSSPAWDLIVVLQRKPSAVILWKSGSSEACGCCSTFNKTPPAHTTLVGSTASIQWAQTHSPVKASCSYLFSRAQHEGPNRTQPCAEISQTSCQLLWMMRVSYLVQHHQLHFVPRSQDCTMFL